MVFLNLLTSPSISDCDQPLRAIWSSSELQNQLPFCELNLVTSLSHLCSYLRAFAPALVSAWSIPPATRGSALPRNPQHPVFSCVSPLLLLLLFDFSVSKCYGLNFRIPDSILMSSVLDKHLVSLGHDYVPDLPMVNPQWLLLSA